MLAISFWDSRFIFLIISLNLSPQTVDPDQDRSSLDPEEPISKRNNSSSPKPVEI